MCVSRRSVLPCVVWLQVGAEVPRSVLSEIASEVGVEMALVSGCALQPDAVLFFTCFLYTILHFVWSLMWLMLASVLIVQSQHVLCALLLWGSSCTMQLVLWGGGLRHPSTEGMGIVGPRATVARSFWW